MRAAARAIAVAAVAASVVVLSACGTGVDTATAEPDAGIQLFQLPWASIAEECETTIGPAGFAWVLTSPPQEHIDRPEWWASYQPVSYEVDTRLGTRDEFADMVARCDAAGVEIIADAVVNHMTGQDQPGTGWAGAPYEHYDYPGLYGTADFHHCGLTANDDIEDYGSREQVQTCELVNLADLDTSSASVRDTIVAYLRDLLSLGVAGFRIDAAKHMAADDVAAIVGALPDGTRIMSEVIRGGGEPVQPEEYTGFGEVFEFTYARDLGPALASGIVNEPRLDGDRPMHVPSDDAVVFIDNHDTERGEAKVTYRQPALYAIANALMLADDYGTPVVYSGYAFSDRDAGAPVEGDGRVTPVACDGVTDPADGFSDGDRTCVQTWPVITGMLAFRAAVGDAARLPGQKEGDAYGFEREGRGVVAVNLGRERQAISIPTSLPSGEYCDVVTGGQDAKTDDGCRGLSYTVAEGAASFDLDPESVAAIHLGSSLSNAER